jgi:hypothetical protein
MLLAFAPITESVLRPFLRCLGIAMNCRPDQKLGVNSRARLVAHVAAGSP